MKLHGTTTFDYHVTAPTPVQLMLRPRREAQQAILQESFEIAPTVVFSEYADHYGNHCQRAILPVGEVRIMAQVTALVTPYEAPTEPVPAFVAIEDLPDVTMPFLLPSRYCQSDLPEIYQLACEIVGNLPTGYAQVEAIRNWIYTNIRYQYGTTNATTTALDLVRQRVGVCRDFTHLALSLCRSLCMPARMTVGYLDKLKFMDLHAWFEVYLTNGWHTFDAVQPQTEGGRVVLGYGRDAADVAMVTQFGDAQLKNMTVTLEITQETA